MHITLINPPSPPVGHINRDVMGGFGALSTKGDICVPPLNLAYAASVLKSANHSVEIIDAAAEKLNDIGVIKRIKSNTDLVCLNTGASSIFYDLNLAKKIKKIYNTFICVTGVTVTNVPELALTFGGVDLVIRNEIEQTILDIIKYFKNKKEQLKKLKSISYKLDNKIINNPSNKPIQDLDNLPFPARELLPNKLYRGFYPHESPLITMLTSRGCPYNCMYCPYPVAQGNQFRARTPENVIKELIETEKFIDYKYVLFRDPVFTYDLKRAEEICRLMIKNNLNIKWRCETTTSKLNPELLALMSKAGCIGINLGIETGNKELIKKYAYKTGGIEHIKSIFKACKKVNIETLAFIIEGLPGETLKTIKDTQKLVAELKPTHLIVSAATPFPGTKLREIAEQEKQIKNDLSSYKDYTSINVVYIPQTLTKRILEKQILNTYLKVYLQPKKFFYELFKHPTWFVNNISNVMIRILKKKKY